MKRFHSHALLIAAISLSLSLYGQEEYFFGQLDDIICKEQARAEMHLKHPAQRTLNSHETDIVYQEMHWQINPADYYIKGTITYHFKSLTDGLTQLSLDLAPDLEINSITRQGIPLTYSHSPEAVLTIEWPQNLAKGELDSLTIEYEGMPPSNGFGSFEQSTHAGAPVIWTLSEPYGVRDWWPGKQDLVDKIDSVDIFITTPQGQLAASNGKLMSITPQDTLLVHHWRHRHPIASYLIALAVTNYSAFSHYLPLDNGDTMEILNYVFPESFIQAEQSTLQTLDFLRLYNELFGTYPFADEKYGHAQFGWGGGMEHQTMSFMGNFGYELQAHELAHQWFGDKVTCGSWVDIWLNEGFATYMTGLTYERYSPELYWPLWKNSVTNFVTSQPGGSVFVDDTTSVNRIFNSRLTYNKGAYLLHMLRWIIGDEAFFNACRDYLNNEGTAYDFGRTHELQAYLEDRAGRDLDYFFEDWFYGQGFPQLDLEYQENGDSLILYLSQRPSHAAVDFFELPIPVEISLDGQLSTLVLEHAFNHQRYAFYTGNASLDSIRIDPKKWLLTRNNTIEPFTTAVSDPSVSHQFQLMPMPAKDLIRIWPSEGIVSIRAHAVTGAVYSLSVLDGQVNTGSLTPGYYIIELVSDVGEVLFMKPLLILR